MTCAYCSSSASPSTQRRRGTLSNPNFTRLSPVARIASSFDRGCQPSICFALALEPFFRFPSSGSISRASGLNQAPTRISQSGSCRVLTLLPSTLLTAARPRIFRTCCFIHRQAGSPQERSPSTPHRWKTRVPHSPEDNGELHRSSRRTQPREPRFAPPMSQCGPPSPGTRAGASRSRPRVSLKPAAWNMPAHSDTR